MAKKAEQVVPEIIDSVEGLNAKMAAMLPVIPSTIFFPFSGFAMKSNY